MNRKEKLIGLILATIWLTLAIGGYLVFGVQKTQVWQKAQMDKTDSLLKYLNRRFDSTQYNTYDYGKERSYVPMDSSHYDTSTHYWMGEGIWQEKPKLKKKHHKKKPDRYSEIIRKIMQINALPIFQGGELPPFTKDPDWIKGAQWDSLYYPRVFPNRDFISRHELDSLVKRQDSLQNIKNL